jgi:hypothetical protein
LLLGRAVRLLPTKQHPRLPSAGQKTGLLCESQKAARLGEGHL